MWKSKGVSLAVANINLFADLEPVHSHSFAVALLSIHVLDSSQVLKRLDSKARICERSSALFPPFHVLCKFHSCLAINSVRWSGTLIARSIPESCISTRSVLQV